MTNFSTGFVITGAFTRMDAAEDVVAAALAPLRDAFHRKPKSAHRITEHSERYNRQLLDGTRAISLLTFVRFLFASYRPDSPAECDSREFIRRILDAIARPFGLTVVPAENRPVSDVKTEVVEANDACARAFVAVHDATADGRMDDNDRNEVRRRVINAQRELNDLVAVGR
jgi:hypothetical protein